MHYIFCYYRYYHYYCYYYLISILGITFLFFFFFFFFTCTLLKKKGKMEVGVAKPPRQRYLVQLIHTVLSILL